MSLYIETDLNFQINQPYFYLKSNIQNLVYDIYCDGTYLKAEGQGFCCIGGVIINHDTKEKVGEFFAPVPIKNKRLNPPRFEKIAIITSLLIKENHQLKIHTIFTDSKTDAQEYSQEKNIKWIPRIYNLADEIVSYAKQQWKEQIYNQKKKKITI